MKRIQVLMSTYNGVNFLREQLDSIFNQDCERKNIAKVYLLVRDDGSCDGTTEVLKEYAERYSEQMVWYQGNNIGVINSFFELLNTANQAMDYYAFSDQDDFWLTNKLTMAIRKIEIADVNKPVLYCCQSQLVDARFNKIESKINRSLKRPSFGNALIENICSGCTSVINQELFQIIKAGYPKYVIMHDWWIYLIASFFGEVYYDETPYILYRQHLENVVGMNSTRIAEFLNRVKNFKGNRKRISKQVTEFLRIFEYAIELKRNDQIEKMEMAKILIKSRTEVKLRKRVLSDKRIYRQRKFDYFIFRIIICIGCY